MKKNTADKQSHMPHKPHHFATKKVIGIGILFIVLALVALIGISYLSTTTQEDSNTPPTGTPSSTISPSENDTSLLPPDWKRYTQSTEGWQINYPTEAQVNELDAKNAFGSTGIGQAVTFFFKGPTQTEGTELYDGYSLSVGLAQKPQKQSLESFAIDQSFSDPISERISFEKVTFNSMDGYEAVVRGLGTYHQFYFAHPIDESRVIRLSYMIGGVEGEDSPYEEKVRKMVNSLQFSETSSAMCTMDAKICPDGSTVGRQGPNCEFAACPLI